MSFFISCPHADSCGSVKAFGVTYTETASMKAGGTAAHGAVAEKSLRRMVLG